jgi:mycofactocin precursor
MYSYSSRSAETKEHDMPETDLLVRPADETGLTEGGMSKAGGTDATDITAVDPAEVVAADLLVEEISIDGMCGVY